MEQSRELNIKELRAIFPQASINDTLSDDLFISEMRYISEMERRWKDLYVRPLG